MKTMLGANCALVALLSANVALASNEVAVAPYFSDWPAIHSVIAKDETIENRIKEILAKMTLDEKIGQMLQPDFREITPEEVAQYKIGSVLNGGGGWPDNNKHSPARSWVSEADKYWIATDKAFAGRGFRIPFMWATDAVHGHNNVFQATLFPHNIGLGAAHDPDLIYRIGQATALEVAATGLDWTFAPTVAVPRDDRWGRTYEGYSEDPSIVYAYAKEMVRGLQGSASDLKGQHHVISTVKHFVGDGGTLYGVDRGDTNYSEDDLRNIHAVGYFSGLDAGAQAVMASFNSWKNDNNSAMGIKAGSEYNGKLHGSYYMLTQVLKDKMGFDGIVISDWNGHSEISGCSMGDCEAAVLAGIDIFMVTARKDWMSFRTSLLDSVNNKTVPMSRIDDAVSRILRVKMRAGMWDKPMPSQRTLAGKQSILGNPDHRALAREAVRKSLVLLKNKNNILPLSRDLNVLVAGSAANDISKQIGGWSLTWQGTENNLSDFPDAVTVAGAIEKTIGKHNVMTLSSSQLDLKVRPDVAIVAMGEDSYAEWLGDIPDNKTLSYSELKAGYSGDLKLLRQLNKAGIPTVVILLSGRPLYVNEEINLADAFVAAWLPGTQAEGITDVIFRDTNGTISHDFQGALSFSWPAQKCATTINAAPTNIAGWQRPEFEQKPDKEHVLFNFGYGLTYNPPSRTAANYQDLDRLPLDNRRLGCRELSMEKAPVATTRLELFGEKASDEHRLRMGDESNWTGTEVSINGKSAMQYISVRPVDYKRQQDAREVTFMGTSESTGASIQLQTTNVKGINRNNYLKANSNLMVTLRVKKKPDRKMEIGMQCGWPCASSIAINETLNTLPLNKWVTLSIPLTCFKENMDFSKTNTPFIMTTTANAKLDLGLINWTPAAVNPEMDNIVQVNCDGTSR